MSWILSLARKASPEARSLLDIAAGSGLLVAEAARAGLDAVTIERSHCLAAVAARNSR